jgi:2-amino-4-hydroxy-6-hydroxymethyldihydropteridine diphosphokinase
MQVIIGLGSNLGNKIQNILNAINLAKSLLSLQKISLSRFYISTALIKEDSKTADNPEFINASLSCECYQSPYELLRSLKYVEQKIGRTFLKDIWAPRIIDLDILFYEQNIIQTDELTIPHKEVASRDFALEPICDIKPYYYHPLEGKLLLELKQELGSKYVAHKFQP